MNIGILTFHRAHNYGAVLQAYAMQSFLEQLGHHAFLIDYRNEFLEEQYKLFSWKFYLRVGIKAPAHFVNRFLSFCKRVKRRESFNKFIANFIKNENGLDCDVIVFGSDQIWNPSVTGGFDENYWGNIFPKNKIIRIAYAPSLEAGKIEAFENRIRLALKRFSALSVREEDLRVFLQKYTERDIKLVCDPTFLVSPNVYDKILSPLNIKQDFLVIYQVNRNSLTYQVAEFLAKRHNLRIIEFGQNTSILHTYRYQNTAGPGEFVWAIKNAKFVVTSSFHGTAFSIILKKQFFVTSAGIKDKRMKNLLSIAKMEDRLIADAAAVEKLCKIDYSVPLGNLNNYIEQSQSFIKESLNKNV